MDTDPEEPIKVAEALQDFTWKWECPYCNREEDKPVLPNRPNSWTCNGCSKTYTVEAFYP